MLIYDHALDPYHTAIRILAISTSAQTLEIKLTLDAARIADYFLVYPAKVLNFRFPKEFRNIRTEAKALENPYRNASGMKTSFERMRPIFFAALSGLAAANLISIKEYKEGYLVRSNEELPTDLMASVIRYTQRQSSIGNFILFDLLKIPSHGIDGLKHRSGLIEYRYDAI